MSAELFLALFSLSMLALSIFSSLKVVLSLPVLSSDDDSDDENSQSSADDAKGDEQPSPPSVQDGGSVEPSESQGGVPGIPAKDGSPAKDGIPAKDGGSASAEDSQGHVAPTPLPQGQQVLFTTTDFYLVLRLHHLLAERLTEAKRLCREAGLSRQTVVASPEEVGRFFVFCMAVCLVRPHYFTVY